MKKNLIAVAVAAMAVVPTVSFAADTKVYGRFNIGLENLKDEIGLVSGGGVIAAPTEKVWRLRDMNNSSRLGFKGKEDVGLGDLAVIYQLEYGIDPDGSEGSAFSQRNIFVGLTGGFGTVKFGKFDTLIKDAGAKVDQF
ncbi:MAG TPA: porin, partial [Solimonas sp.]